MANPLNDFGARIFLDRYALKDMSKKSLAAGDVVVACVSQKTRQREIGTVTSIVDGQVTLELRDGTVVTQGVEDVDKALETTPEQTMARVAWGAAEVEASSDKKALWEANFQWLLDEWRFVPGGRILNAAGTNQKLSLFNCYVIKSPKDSRKGILDSLGEMTEIMSRGGGVGVNLSSLRPRHAFVKGVNGRSSGSTSWGGLFSFVTGLIEQGGSRRGALMLITNDWHPDVLDFIDSKREAGKITNANISVGISDALMDAVAADGDWVLEFPDTTHKAYAKEWTGDLSAWKAAGHPTNTHKTIKARMLWDKIIESAWASAEPGVFFLERYNKESNSAYFAPIVACNPCAEQGLPAYGCCNLGALNLAKFVNSDGTVAWDDLGKAVAYAVRFLDNVIDLNDYFMREIETQQLNERRVGLGLMGLAEMMIKLRLRYGSEAGNDFVGELGKFLATSAYKASADIAAEKGSFPAFNAELLLQSGFASKLPEDVRSEIRTKGLRNVTLLTVAPTGTTGTMVDTSTGVEPYYSWTYFRKSRLGMDEIEVDIVKDWRDANPGVKDLPDYFVTAMDLTPEQHVGVQAALQRWIDSSISKTCNVPNEYTVEQTKALYELMYKLGCKGGTIYRDGSRSEQVLSLKKEEPKAETPVLDLDAEARARGYIKPEDVLGDPALVAKVLAAVGATSEPVHKARRRPKPIMTSISARQQTPLGSCYVNVTYDTQHEPLEVFVTSGKAGSDVSSLAEALGRVVSLMLRLASPTPPTERLSELADQLTGIGGSDSVGFGRAKIKSLPDAVGKSLAEIIEHLQEMQQAATAKPVQVHEPVQVAKPKAARKAGTADLCPACGQATYIREEGCMHCTSCGHSACG